MEYTRELTDSKRRSSIRILHHFTDRPQMSDMVDLAPAHDDPDHDDFDNVEHLMTPGLVRISDSEFHQSAHCDLVRDAAASGSGYVPNHLRRPNFSIVSALHLCLARIHSACPEHADRISFHDFPAHIGKITIIVQMLEFLLGFEDDVFGLVTSRGGDSSSENRKITLFKMKCKIFQLGENCFKKIFFWSARNSKIECFGFINYAQGLQDIEFLKQCNLRCNKNRRIVFKILNASKSNDTRFMVDDLEMDELNNLSWTTSFCIMIPFELSNFAFPDFSFKKLLEVLSVFLELLKFLEVFGKNSSTWYSIARDQFNSIDNDDEDTTIAIVVNQSNKKYFHSLSNMLHKVWQKSLLLQENKTSYLISRGEYNIKDTWNFLSSNIQENILARLDIETLTRAKMVSKSFKDIIDSDMFHTMRGVFHPKEGVLTILFFYILGGMWHCKGYDLCTKSWRLMPPFTYLPDPNFDLFKEYSICGDGGLMCVNVSKSLSKEKLVVFNPMTKQIRWLPPLHFRRNPVLLQISVYPLTKSYKVIAFGSSSGGDGNLSKTTEVFDSLISEWKVTQDLPGPNFALNEYQTGVFLDGILYCISFLDGVLGKGVMAYNVDKGEWLSNWTCHLPMSTTANILQLVKNNNKVYLFSEQEQGGIIDHCIYVLEIFHNGLHVVGNWRLVLTESKGGKKGLQVYPEYSCVPFGNDNLCIFNSIEYVGVVYNVLQGKRVQSLVYPLRNKKGNAFYSLNPMSFMFEPNFREKIT